MKLIHGTQRKIFSFFIVLSLGIVAPLIGKEDKSTTEEVITSSKEVADIVFNYENEDIVTIINQLAAQKNMNVLFPQAEVLNVKVTLHMDKKLTLSQAWDILNMLLDVAGFFIVPQESLIKIIKSGKEMYREPVPTYIGTDPLDLPNNDQTIRYLYYFANLRVSEQPDNEINGILKDLLPADTTLYKGDSATNSLLIVAKANDIRAAMKILLELDKIDFQETVDILTLHHTSAHFVAELINKDLIKSDNTNPYRLDTKKPKDIPYFSGFTKVVPLEAVRLNKLLLLGKPQATERLKDFIIKYIDVAPDTGESLLHIYHLQYLDAGEFAPVLDKIVKGGPGSDSPNQASAGESKGAGPERFFDKVIIHTDRPVDAPKDNANLDIKEQQYTYYGGNNLVIAARHDDWKRIKKLIEELDIPQPQVLLEVLVADLSANDTRVLGSMARVPKKVPIPDRFSFQSAQFDQVIPTVLPGTSATPNANVDADILSLAYKADGTLANPTPGVASLADFAQAGTTMLSLNDNDGSTWSILELLQLMTSSKILSHPHVMSKNNKQATIQIGQRRWLKDKVKGVASNYYGGATTIDFKPIDADLTVKITPRISSGNTVNLQVSVDINEWLAGTANAQEIRLLVTNANIKNGGIFALGGLIRTTANNTLSEVPILGRIPIIGWFFKRKSNLITKNNLTVFICPTIIEPRLRDGISQYTQDYIDAAKDYARDDLFDSLKDPITHWFFSSTAADTAAAIDKFTAEDEKLANIRKYRADKDDKKTINPELAPLDSAAPITTKAGLTISHNDISGPEQWDELKKALEQSPNPFLTV